MKDGGSAFPILDTTQGNNINSLQCIEGGMSLRDYFAAHSLNKLTRPTRPVHDECYALGRNALDCIAWDAKVAYAYADAMLAEREKNYQEEEK